MAITFIGSTTGTGTSGASITLLLSGIAGIATGDFVYIMSSTFNRAANEGRIGNALGFTQDRDVANSNRLRTAWKVYNSATDGSCIVEGSGLADGMSAVALVFRGGSVLDVTSVTATGASTNPDSPAITPIQANGCIIIGAGSAVVDATPSGTITNYLPSTPVNTNASSTASSTAAMAYRIKVGGQGSSEDPPAFNSWTTSSWVSFTAALRESVVSAANFSPSVDPVRPRRKNIQQSDVTVSAAAPVIVSAAAITSDLRCRPVRSRPQLQAANEPIFIPARTTPANFGLQNFEPIARTKIRPQLQHQEPIFVPVATPTLAVISGMPTIVLRSKRQQQAQEPIFIPTATTFLGVGLSDTQITEVKFIYDLTAYGLGPVTAPTVFFGTGSVGAQFAERISIYYPTAFGLGPTVAITPSALSLLSTDGVPRVKVKPAQQSQNEPVFVPTRTPSDFGTQGFDVFPRIKLNPQKQTQEPIFIPTQTPAVFGFSTSDVIARITPKRIGSAQEPVFVPAGVFGFQNYDRVVSIRVKPQAQAQEPIFATTVTTTPAVLGFQGFDPIITLKLKKLIDSTDVFFRFTPTVTPAPLGFQNFDPIVRIRIKPQADTISETLATPIAAPTFLGVGLSDVQLTEVKFIYYPTAFGLGPAVAPTVFFGTGSGAAQVAERSSIYYPTAQGLGPPAAGFMGIQASDVLALLRGKRPQPNPNEPVFVPTATPSALGIQTFDGVRKYQFKPQPQNLDAPIFIQVPAATPSAFGLQSFNVVPRIKLRPPQENPNEPVFLPTATPKNMGFQTFNVVPRLRILRQENPYEPVFLPTRTPITPAWAYDGIRRWVVRSQREPPINPLLPPVVALTPITPVQAYDQVIRIRLRRQSEMVVWPLIAPPFVPPPAPPAPTPLSQPIQPVGGSGYPSHTWGARRGHPVMLSHDEMERLILSLPPGEQHAMRILLDDEEIEFVLMHMDDLI